MNNKKTFVGFGFGPIQSGLFLFEAWQSKNFSRYVVAEVDQKLVDAVRNNKGRYSINVARKDGIDKFTLEGIEIYNPRDNEDRRKLIEAVGESDEIATALPSVKIYDAGGDAGVTSILRQGITNKQTIIYAAENNNHAAEILSEHLGKTASVEILNTVIGKMSGVITDEETIRAKNLITVTPDISRAILVEEFNRILISEIHLPEYHRGIEVFEEKPDLLPFEEAKLYGHNAVHALIGYLADMKGIETIAQAGEDKEIMKIARKAFIDESGSALIKRHSDLGDRLFTPDGYAEFADDLLERMVNPNLNDLVSRVGRDHARKLGYHDRLFGTMHIALENGIEPRNLAMGAAAGVLSMLKRKTQAGISTKENLRNFLLKLWSNDIDNYADAMINLTWEEFVKINDE